MAEKPMRKCPRCRKKVERLIGPGGGILFKGSGFHTTDYRSEGYKKAAKKDREKKEKKEGKEKKSSSKTKGGSGDKSS
jgi:predicted nucleic acid-binding Zn ribbon protein